MFYAWPLLSNRFEQAVSRAGRTACPRITDLRSGSLFFFLNFLDRKEQEQEEPCPLLLLTETTQQAVRYMQFMQDVIRLTEDREPWPGELLVLPDIEPQSLFEYSDPPLEVAEGRSEVLDHLSQNEVRIVFTAYKSTWRRLPDPDEFQAQVLMLTSKEEAGEALAEISREELASHLEDLGYSQVTTVTRIGEYALRGGLVDVFPGASELPVRIDLFGSRIEEMSHFDPQTQRTTDRTSELRITGIGANKRMLAQPEAIGRLEDKWRDYEKAHAAEMSRSALSRIREVFETDIGNLADGVETPRLGWYLRSGAFRSHCLWHYLPEGTQVIAHEDGFVDSETNSYFRFWENRFSDWLKNGLSFLDLSDYFFQPAASIGETLKGLSTGLVRIAAGKEKKYLEVPQSRPLLTHSFSGPEAAASTCFSVNLQSILETTRWGTSKIADSIAQAPAINPQLQPMQDLASQSPGLTRTYDRPVSILTQFAARLREIMEEAGVKPEIEGAILPGGFVIPDEQGDPLWTVVTDMEIFGEIAEITPAPTRKYRRDAIRRTDELNPGDYVVHIDYGIGRFSQLADREVAGARKSFVEVEYAERDKLFVPVDQLDRLRKYSFDGTDPPLSHLGRDTWKKTREKVQRDTLELAKKLLSLYKTRMLKPGHSYASATVWQDEFADGFPYRLTEDQMAAWRDVESDMESEKAMDRLICGDVGFGKTEIAMRAAFKACIDEYQVLVLCPTTILADQHFRTFRSRFKAFPFRIGLLSRFQSTKEQKEIIEKLKTGRMDVLIATHRALSKDIDFKRLGLLVVDEEQRFGVKQKEKMKMKWPDTDVLSMSATPIPRTLHMSLIGLRDISLIESAPVARKPVKTYVGEYDELLAREAMLRELGRGGQIYFLHNKVQDIDRTRADIERMVPGVQILIGHGQMRESRLEEVMHAFSLGAYKILLATTIIENGLDIPTVNTIIVDQAENLGLAQMHQLRGRVGRSNVQAYAHFFHSPNRVLSEDAQNRLHAIYNYAYLGAGYEIAQSDLRIRGAGNLLGAAQSGLAKQVGFEYYCELLARSISDVKALDEANIEEWGDAPVLSERPGTQLDLPLTAYIPETYVSDPVLRLELLRDIAGLGSQDEVDAFAAELDDRFGQPPAEVRNLLLVSSTKIVATGAGLEQLSYNRVKELFQLRFFEDEPDWYKRAPLMDSRFSRTYQNQVELSLPFHRAEDAVELVETLQGLVDLKARGKP